LGGARRLDLALTALMTGLAYRPEGFPLVGSHGLRVAKTESVPSGDDAGDVPALTLYFQIADTGEVVLWWIEETLDEDWDLPF
jgi:hypothetical protein